MRTKENVLVAGANGTTGKHTVEILEQSEAYTPIAMVRKKDQQGFFHDKGVKTVLADLENEDAISQAVQQMDKVIFAAGSGGTNVIGVDQEGAKRMIDASEKAGVKKFVMLGSIGTDDPSQGGDLKAYLEAKQNADKHLRASNLDYTIVRPGQLTNGEGTGKIQTGGPAKLDKSGSIPRVDVAKTLVALLKDHLRLHQTFEILSGDTPIEKAVAAD